jgi:hypothetical protein
MSNSGFVENRAHAVKSQSFIKAHNGDLRVQIDPPGATLDGGPDGALQQLPADALSPVAFDDRHASDLCVAAPYDQPRRAHGFARGDGQKVSGAAIVGVQFDLLRHTLFYDEYTQANREGLPQILWR